MVGLESYANGTKQTWRGWQWNRIAERIPKDKRATATCVYLIGPDDFDRHHALRAGFRNRNIIGVDVDVSNVNRVKRSGGVAIDGVLSDLVAMWPSDLPLDVIAADFTCGFGDAAVDFALAAECSAAVHRQSVFSVNLQRGRDPSSNFVRTDVVFRCALTNVEKVYREPGFSHFAMRPFYGDEKLAEPIKHRGFQWQYMVSFSAALNARVTNRGRLKFSEWAKVVAHMRPIFGSYKSKTSRGCLVFDTVVSTWPSNSILKVGSRGLRPSREQLAQYVSAKNYKKY